MIINDHNMGLFTAPEFNQWPTLSGLMICGTEAPAPGSVWLLQSCQRLSQCWNPSNDRGLMCPIHKWGFWWVSGGSSSRNTRQLFRGCPLGCTLRCKASKFEMWFLDLPPAHPLWSSNEWTRIHYMVPFLVTLFPKLAESLLVPSRYHRCSRPISGI
jgi:hypothetical protein